MNGEIVNVAIIATTLGAATVGGIFFGFSSFIMAALGRVGPEAGIAAMQAINVTVLNRWFFGVFFGTAVVALALTVLGLLTPGSPGSAWLIAGGLLYVVGCILVTIVCNVPLNDRLAAADPASPAGRELWAHYLTVWTRWNTVRTVASLAAAASFVMALV